MPYPFVSVKAVLEKKQRRRMETLATTGHGEGVASTMSSRQIYLARHRIHLGRALARRPNWPRGWLPAARPQLPDLPNPVRRGWSSMARAGLAEHGDVT